MAEKKRKTLHEEVLRLREENHELRKFVNYVRSLKTDEDFLNLKKVLEKANEKFSSQEKENEE